ncbi:hypothetical protein BDR04DRAFT_1200024 [Suillus decipiens]|nr:hypothetical protein BDR04DRAFT_1200024 [Suillus decipiens]
MSSRHWFSKRVTTPKTSTFDDLGSTEKLPIHVESSKLSDNSKLSSFASVMGRKSKKSRPTLAIPDSPLPSLVSAPAGYSNPRQYTNRPPAKSISSTLRSGDDSLEPRTPPDVQTDRVSFPRSVLTLSDPDPFASGGISVPRSILDRGRISAYSGRDLLLLQKEICVFNSFSRETFKRNEIIDDRNFLESPLYCNSSSIPSLSKQGSVVTLTDQSRQGPPDLPTVAVRSPIYPRCYTAPNPFQGARRTVSRKKSAPASAEVYVRSRTLSRQQSISRPAPACELPPPPTMSRVMSAPADDGAESEIPLSADGSSSGILCASATWRIQDLAMDEINNQRYRPYKETSLGSVRDFETQRQLVKELSRIHVGDTTESSSPPLAFHQLKKSMSHSTLQKTKSGSSGTQEFFRGDKGLKKQHSFHRSRVHTSPTPASPSTPPGHDPLPAESNIPPLPRRHTVVRKRMFSGSRKSSTAITDEDLRSVFSLPTEAGRSHLVSPRTVVSLLDEPSSESLASDIVYPAAEFTPQYIMSPAEMLKMEAIVQGEFDAKYGEVLRNPQRPTFASTPMYGAVYRKEGLKTTLSPFTRSAPIRSASIVSKGPTPRSFPRPSTAQTPLSTLASQSSSTIVSLSPPPRPRARPHTADRMYHEDPFNRRSSSVPFIPLSPPPRLKCANAIRTPSVVCDTAVPRRSVIRKPSFLEIADDTICCEGSFLDFDSGKESFDLFDR